MENLEINKNLEKLMIIPVWKIKFFELEHPVQCVPVCIVRVALATLVAYERVCYNWPFIFCGRAAGTFCKVGTGPPHIFGQIMPPPLKIS